MSELSPPNIPLGPSASFVLGAQDAISHLRWYNAQKDLWMDFDTNRDVVTGCSLVGEPVCRIEYPHYCYLPWRRLLLTKDCCP